MAESKDSLRTVCGNLTYFCSFVRLRKAERLGTRTANVDPEHNTWWDTGGLRIQFPKEMLSIFPVWNPVPIYGA